MTAQSSTLVCFAVRQEASHFKHLIRAHSHVQVLLTGMGRRNAEKSVSAALIKYQPRQVISAGFAGGLIGELIAGSFVFQAEDGSLLRPRLLQAGARPVRFHCSDQVITTAAEKRALHARTGAEAVDMESEFIQALCRARHIPVATVRVILDTADEDLAVDFNGLMTPELELDNKKLALLLLKSPSKIGALLRLQKQSAAAGKRLAAVLGKLLNL
jgi:nucleoside phosphorylase